MDLSILIATYNRKLLLQENLENVLYQINEDKIEDVEVIVSVNPSNDGTEDYLNSVKKTPFFKYMVNNTNIGGIPNMYQLIRNSKGKFIWLLSDDDNIAPGTIKKVHDAIKKYPNLGWIYLNLARLNKNKLSKEYIYSIDDNLNKGYKENGKKELEKQWKRIPGNILFQSSNIYLREPTLEVMDTFPKGNRCPWVYFVFNSVANRGAYIISYVSILQRIDQSWTDSYYKVTCLQFQQMILYLGNLDGYTDSYAKKTLRYYMTHEGLIYWLYLFKWIVCKPKEGINAYLFFLKSVPLTTLIMTIILPLEFVFMISRHYIVRKASRFFNHKRILSNLEIIPLCWRKYVSSEEIK